MKETKLRYSEPLLREAVRAFVFRAVIRGFGVRFFIACAVMAVCASYLVYRGDRSWLVGVLATLLLFIGIFFLVIYLAHHRNTVGRFRQMRVPEASLSYNDEQFTLASELGSATFPWSAITDVWHFPRFWLILFSPSQFATLPLECLDAETQAFITRKTQRNESNA